MSIQWIRDNYGVPAKRGGRVEYTPCEGSKDGVALGTIVGTSGQYLKIRLDGDKTSFSYHPTWQLRYLDAPSPSPSGERG